MEDRVDVAVRWARATLLGVVALTSGVVAHVSAGGLLPRAVPLALLAAVCVASAAALLGRPASTLRVVVLLVAGQTVVHGVLTSLSGHRGDPPLQQPARAVPLPVPTGGGDRTGSLYDQLYGAGASDVAATPLVLPAPVQHLVHDLTGPHAWMAVAHLVAAAVVGLWLAVGERALWTLVALAARAATIVHALVAAVALETPVLTTRRPRAARPAPPLPLRGLVLARSTTRRGPPALLPA